jgi:putative sterol carrier protein
MTLYALTPEWQKAAAKVYREDLTFKRTFDKVHGTPVMLIQANKFVGVEIDLYLLNRVENGVLLEDGFVRKEEGENKATWLLSGSYETWKDVFTGKKVFIEAFLGGEIRLKKGEFAALMKIAAQGTKLAEIFTRNEAVWPDELPKDEVEKYRKNHLEWTKAL